MKTISTLCHGTRVVVLAGINQGDVWPRYALQHVAGQFKELEKTKKISRMI